MSRPLFVFGRFDQFQRVRMEWSEEDRERSRFVKAEYSVRGVAEGGADYVVLDGYTTLQSEALVLAQRRGFTCLGVWELRSRGAGKAESA